MPKNEPTLSDALKNASTSASGLLPGLLEDPVAYLATATERGGIITEQEVLPTGVVQTTFTFNAGDPSEYTEKVFTNEPFPADAPLPVAPPQPPNAPPVAEPLPEVENAVEQALASTGPLDGAGVDFARATEAEVKEDRVYYTEPLRAMLVNRHQEIQDEIARLARLTESAMKADSAIMNALSSLDRDGV